MSAGSQGRFEDSAAAQQRFLSLFLRCAREVFRHVAALAPDIGDAEDLIQQTALALWERSGRTVAAANKMRSGFADTFRMTSSR